MMRKLFVLLLFCFLGLSHTLTSQTTVERQVDILTLRFLLSNDLFRELQQRMDSYQHATVQDAGKGTDLHRAVRAFRVNDTRMMQQLDQWVRKYPRSPAAHTARGALSFYLGRTYARAGRHTDAQPLLQRASEDISRAEELDPSFIESKTLKTEMLTSFGDLAGARRVLDEGLAVDPVSFDLRRKYLWGIAPHTNPNAGEEMQRVLSNAATQLNMNPQLRFLRGFPDLFAGLASQNAGKHREAIGHFTRALDAGPFFEFFLFRAISYEALGDLEDALGDFEAVLKDFRQSIDAVRGKARVLQTLGRRAEAGSFEKLARDLQSFVEPVRGGIASSQEIVLPDLTAAAPSEPSDTTVQASRIEQPPDSSSAEEVNTDGIEDLTEKVNGDPQNPSIWFQRGMAYLAVRSYSEAADDFRKVLELDPRDIRAHFNLGWIFLHNSMYEEGIAKNSDAIGLNPNFGQAYLNRSFGNRMLGRIDEAMPDLQKACELGVQQACTLLRIAAQESADQNGKTDTE